jgi:hypothetical protein
MSTGNGRLHPGCSFKARLKNVYSGDSLNGPANNGGQPESLESNVNISMSRWQSLDSAEIRGRITTLATEPLGRKKRAEQSGREHFIDRSQHYSSVAPSGRITRS